MDTLELQRLVCTIDRANHLTLLPEITVLLSIASGNAPDKICMVSSGTRDS
jgi:hypothetical protein